MPQIEIRQLITTDPDMIARAFTALGWPGKTVDRYHSYLDDQRAGARTVFVSLLDGRFAGYVTVYWDSTYEPFRASGIPEIQDLNVLPQFRHRRMASALVDTAERTIAARSDTAGIGVGLYADYAAAHLMYLRRGYVPDGHGVAYRGATAQPGSLVRVDDGLVLMMTRRLR